MVYNNLTDEEIQAPSIEISGITIRKMQLRDLDAVYELEKKIFKKSWSRNNFVYEILDSPISFPYVIAKDQQVIGYAIYWRVDNEAHIANLAIDENYRRRKLGSLLLRYLLKEMMRQKVQVIYLEVRRSNIAAQNLYLKHGFEYVGVRNNYYIKDKEDALLMSLFVKEVQRDGLV